MRKWFDALLHGATLLLLVASPVSAADRLTTGVGIGIWRFSAPSAELDAALGGSRVTVTGSIFGEYVDGPYFLGLRIGYIQKLLPNGLRHVRGTGQKVMVSDPSLLRLLPITLEFGLERGRRTAAKLGAGLGVAALWHDFQPSAVVHTSAENRHELQPVLRVAAGVSTRRGRAALGAEISYLSLVAAQEAISKAPGEALHGFSLEARIGFR